MQIIEQTIVPKHPDRRSEDGIVVTADFIAVIDGSTSKSTHRYSRHMSNGECAMRTIASYIRRMAPGNSCHQFCLGVTKALHNVYIPFWKPHKAEVIQQLKEHPEDRLTASCIVFSRLRRELWMIGDCQCLISSPSLNREGWGGSSPSLNREGWGGSYLDNPKPYEAMLAQERADIIKSSPKPWDHYLDDDTARQAIIPHMLETMQQQNKTYSVIDGFPIAEKYVRIITLDFQPQELVLASDGYPFLCPTLAESEARLAQQKEKDPLNIGPDFMATKAFAHGNNSFDDRAYIRFTI